jgi:hypothetical protein
MPPCLGHEGNGAEVPLLDQIVRSLDELPHLRRGEIRRGVASIEKLVHADEAFLLLHVQVPLELLGGHGSVGVRLEQL